MHRQLVLYNDSLVDTREELVLFWVVADAVDELVKLGTQLLDDCCTTLPLYLEGLVLIKVFDV